MSDATSRGWPGTLAWALGLLVMALAQYAIRRDPTDSIATLIFLAAALFVVLVVGWGQVETSRGRSDNIGSPTLEPRTRRRGLIAAIVGAVVICGGAAALTVNWTAYYFAGWAVLAVGFAMLSAGLRVFDAPATNQPRWTLTEIACVSGILALGFWLRFHRYSDFPEPFSTHAIEEQQTGLAAYKILTEGARPWEYMVDYYLAAVALAATKDPTFLTIRIPFTIANALTILPIHLLLRRLVAIPVALAGTFLFGVSSWNLLYSRCAHNIFFTNLLVVIVLVMLVHYAQTRRLTVIPWLGLLGGYTLYTYAGYRGTPAFILLFVGGLILADAWRWVRRAQVTARHQLVRDGCALLLTVGLMTAVATPMVALLRADTSNPYYYFEAGGRALANRTYYTSDSTAFLGQRLTRVAQTARIFMHVGDGALTFNEPDAPMLDPVTAVLFTGGLLLAVCFPRRGINAFLLIMFLGLMLVGTVFVQNLDVRRLQGITVFIVTFSALFLDALWRRLPSRPLWLRHTLVPVVVAISAAGVLGWNYDLYFNRMAKNPRVREAFKNQYTTLIRYGRERFQREQRIRHVLLISLLRRFFDPAYYYGSHYAWLHNGYMSGVDLGDLDQVLPPHTLPPSKHPLTVVIQEPYERGIVSELVTKAYPGTRCRTFAEPDIRRTAMTVCDLPDAPVARPVTSHLRARYWLGRTAAATSGPPFLERDEPFIGYALVPSRCYDVNLGEYCFAEWIGDVEIAKEGDYRFTGEVRGQSTIEITVDGAAPGTGVLRLSPGRHRIVVRAQLPRETESGVRLLWTRNGHAEVVPFFEVEDWGSKTESSDQ